MFTLISENYSIVQLQISMPNQNLYIKCTTYRGNRHRVKQLLSKVQLHCQVHSHILSIIQSSGRVFTSQNGVFLSLRCKQTGQYNIKCSLNGNNSLQGRLAGHCKCRGGRDDVLPSHYQKACGGRRNKHLLRIHYMIETLIHFFIQF